MAYNIFAVHAIAEIYRSSIWLLFCRKAVLKTRMKLPAYEAFKTAIFTELFETAASESTI